MLDDERLRKQCLNEIVEAWERHEYAEDLEEDVECILKKYDYILRK